MGDYFINLQSDIMKLMQQKWVDDVNDKMWKKFMSPSYSFTTSSGNLLPPKNDKWHVVWTAMNDDRMTYHQYSKDVTNDELYPFLNHLEEEQFIIDSVEPAF